MSTLVLPSWVVPEFDAVMECERVARRRLGLGPRAVTTRDTGVTAALAWLTLSEVSPVTRRGSTGGQHADGSWTGPSATSSARSAAETRAAAALSRTISSDSRPARVSASHAREAAVSACSGVLRRRITDKVRDVVGLYLDRSDGHRTVARAPRTRSA